MNNNTSGLSQILFSRYNKQKYTEAEILEGILQKNDNMYRYIYKSYFPGIKAMVFGFHSLVLDADDIFQDGLVAASSNIMGSRFKGDSSFYTYLSSICRNICLKQLERANKMPVTTIDIPDTYEHESVSEELIYRLTFLKGRMDEKCREIIDLRFGLSNGNPDINTAQDSEPNVRFEAIATVLDIEPDNARQRFKRCLEKLRETVFNDKAWNEILSTSY